MKTVSLVVTALVFAATIGYLGMCPCGPLPGAWLWGDDAEGPIEDWSFVNDRDLTPLCQVQITTWRPHSINLNCMSFGGELFVSCSQCAGKTWSTNALSHPAGHIRAAGTVYPVTLKRVKGAERLDSIWEARLQKIQGEAQPRPDHWWSFQLVSR